MMKIKHLEVGSNVLIILVEVVGSLSFVDKLASVVLVLCCTGDSTNQIHFEGYQVSNQCMALVNDDCLVPTKDAPELGYVKESSNEQYVPDVFYAVSMISFAY